MDRSLERWAEIEPILARALDVPADDQAELVRRASGGDDELCELVLRLLAAERESAGFLESPLGEVAADLLEVVSDGGSAHGIGPETKVGRYRILEQIGSGGMSRVFLGERDDGTYNQKVAIKVMRAFGAEREERERRFRVEREVLASLQHPGIAKILDGGTTEDHRPFLVMEHVQGLPLDSYCEQHVKALDERLALFVNVCEIVHYAHQRLVVHRDLKPSNILVDDAGRARLLDFGIAKLLAEEGGDEVPRTRSGLFLMTPEYAAPEQMRAEPVTTATDVYALGVVLYELLTGERPFEIAGKSPSEIERIVCSTQPTVPSRVGGSIAYQNAAQLHDLDVIVEKCLAKEPERRYRSAAALADDIERLRSGHPIRARPATRRYRFGRFVRRNRVGMAVAAAALLALIVFSATLLVQQRRTLAERDRARLGEAKARQVTEFLVDLFESVDPSQTRGEDIRAPALLESGTRRLDVGDLDSLLKAELQHVLARVHLGLGRYEEAVELAREAWTTRVSESAEASERLESELLLANALTRGGDLDEASRHLAKLEKATAEEAFGLRVRAGLAQLSFARGDVPKARALYEEVIEGQAALGESAAGDRVATLSGLAFLLVQTGEMEAAHERTREAVELADARLGPLDPRSIGARHELAGVLMGRGDFPQAEEVFLEVLDARRRVLGVSHPAVADGLNSVGSTWAYRGDFSKAEPFFREALELRIETLGDDHPEVGKSLGNMAMTLHRLDKPAEGEAMARRALDHARRTLAADHPSLASRLNTLGILLQEQGRSIEAEPLYREALEIRIAQLGPVAPRVASSKHNLAVVLTDLGRYSDAEALFLDALETRRASGLDPDHPHIRDDLVALRELYTVWGRNDRAAEVANELQALGLTADGEVD